MRAQSHVSMLKISSLTMVYGLGINPIWGICKGGVAFCICHKPQMKSQLQMYKRCTFDRYMTSAKINTMKECAHTSLRMHQLPQLQAVTYVVPKVITCPHIKSNILGNLPNNLWVDEIPIYRGQKVCQWCKAPGHMESRCHLLTSLIITDNW